MTAAPGTTSGLPVDYPARRAAPAVPVHAPLSLKANFSWTLAGNVFYAACQWAMLVVLAKLGAPEKVGQFVLGLAVTAPVMLFSSLKLRSVQATDARGDFRFGDYFALRLLCTAAASVVIAGLALLGGYSREAALVVLAVGAAKALESISDILQGLFQQHERMDWIARSQVVKGTLSLAALAGAFFVTRSTFYASLAMAGAFAATLLVIDLPMAARLLRDRTLLRPRWHPRTVKTLLLLAIPLGVAVAANSLGVNIPRYFLASTGGERMLGIFGAIASPLVAGVLIVNALGQSASPRLAKYYASGQSAAFDLTLKKLIFLGAVLGGAAVAVAAVAGRPILAVLFRPEYASHAGVFVWLVVAAGLQYNYIFMGTAINAMRAFRVQAPLNLVTPLGALVFCGLWVPRYGLRGAGWAMVATAGLEALAHLAVFAYLRRRPRAAPSSR